MPRITANSRAKRTDSHSPGSVSGVTVAASVTGIPAASQTRSTSHRIARKSPSAQGALPLLLHAVELQVDLEFSLSPPPGQFLGEA